MIKLIYFYYSSVSSDNNTCLTNYYLTYISKILYNNDNLFTSVTIKSLIVLIILYFLINDLIPLHDKTEELFIHRLYSSLIFL